jgi:site-specific DNA recombinase
MMRAAIYVRVSTEDQAKHGYSLGAQREACEERARNLGVIEMHPFLDEGVSGALLSRPGLDAMRELVRAHLVDIVVVWDPDRLSRNLSHQLLLTEEIERARIRLEFVNFEWRNTAEGQLFYAMRGAIAQYEKEKIKERTSRGRLQKAKQGKLPLAFRPYGYDYDPDQALLVRNERESSVVCDMFRWLIEEGLGPNGIARRLNLLGVPAKKGGRWHRMVVGQILSNPVYTGRFHANRWDTAGCSLNRHRPKADRVRATLRPSAEWIPIAVPRLVPQSVWEQAQAALQGARRRWAGIEKSEFLLSGLLVCGTCGMSMAGFTGSDWGVKRRKYTCRRSYEGAPTGWCGRAVQARPIEAAIFKVVLEWLLDPEALYAAVAEPSAPTHSHELTEIADGLSQADRGRINLQHLLEQGMITMAEGSEALSRVSTRMATLQERRERLMALPVHPVREPREVWAERVLHFEAGGLPAKEQKQLVRVVIGHIVVGGRSLTIYPAGSPQP